MSINLQKGQKVDLTKGNPNFSNIVVGLGWDPVRESKGLFGGLFGGSAPQIDCDASVIMLEDGDKFIRNEDLIYFGNLKGEGINHTGDNLTGDGDGDDEQIIVKLNEVPQRIKKLVFVVNIYDCVKRKQHFGMIKNAFIRIVDKSNGKEFLKYNLSDNYNEKTALIAGEIYRHNGEWKFAAIGEGTRDASLSDLVRKYI
ncbi:TerD family protein [Peptoanaerobacter stomatis]|uniref:TerD family protein n=1 Tax=Peptoanaerobacter stomatis TaxID=796937 RepID=UPI003FA09C60